MFFFFFFFSSRRRHTRLVSDWSSDVCSSDLALRVATAELSWLLSRGYQSRSALKLVGDRHALRERQRLAVARAACAEASLERRRASRVGERAVAGEGLVVDGFNLVITLEAAL